MTRGRKWDVTVAVRGFLDPQPSSGGMRREFWAVFSVVAGR